MQPRFFLTFLKPKYDHLNYKKSHILKLRKQDYSIDFVILNREEMRAKKLKIA